MCYTSEPTNIMQIRSRELTAPQSLKKSLRKNGHALEQELFYLTGTRKYKI